MELIGSLFLVLALLVLVALFVGRPFLRRAATPQQRIMQPEAQQREHMRSSLLAERDRVLEALQELDFDYGLGKVPEEEYPVMRGDLLRTGADVLRQLEQYEAPGQSGRAEDRVEAAVAARRADAGAHSALSRAAVAEAGTNGQGHRSDELEELIASRKRARQESAGGFCPRCGKPVQKSDKFCSKCGTEVV
jgi:hypothetical protein